MLSLLATYQQIEDLVNIGAYVAGTNLEFDLAVQARPRIVQYLQQESSAPTTAAIAQQQLKDLFAWIEGLERALRAQATKSPPAKAAAK